MISIVSVIVACLFSYIVTITFLSAGYDIYHNPVPQASTGYRDYPTNITLGNYTHDFQGAVVCESDGKDLSPEETEETIKQCFAQYELILKYGFTPDCEKHELADLDWYYDFWYEFLVSGMNLYGFILAVVAAHDIAILSKKKSFCCTKEEWNEHGTNSTCHCVQFRKWVQLLLLFLICFFVVCLGIGCVLFTDMSAISSSFMGNFKYNENGKVELLGCSCGCVLQTPTMTGWTFWFSMHAFMWFMVLYINKIKHSYKMSPRMLTMVAPVPIEMGVYGIDQSIFWRKVAVERRMPSADDPYNQIDVDGGNQEDSIQCGACPCISWQEWTLTVLSYRMFYTVLVAGIWVVILDGFLFFFQIVLRSYDESSIYRWARVLVHVALTFWAFFVMGFTYISLRMIKSKNVCSNLFSFFIFNGIFNATAFFAYVNIAAYSDYEILTYIALGVWGLMTLTLLVTTLLAFACWRDFASTCIANQELREYTLKLFERDSMGQNFQYFYTLGGPKWWYPQCCLTIMDYKEGPREFAMANGRCSTVIEAGTPASTGGVELEITGKREPLSGGDACE